MRRTSPILVLLAACGSPAPATTTDTATSEPCVVGAWFADNDGDGYGDANQLTLSCEPVLHAVQGVGDCDDTDPLVHPDAPDAGCDGRDDDCDGIPDDQAELTRYYADQDGDGIGGTAEVRACAQPAGFADRTGDCDDGDAEVHPGAPEACNGEDDNCDGYLPPDELDLDLDGYAACAGDCDDGDANRSPGATEACNGEDDDCDGAIPVDEFDLDTDGQSPCRGDCDDGNPTILAGGIEQPADGVDGDCDGTELCFRDADHDGIGTLTHTLSLDLDCHAPGESIRQDDCNDLDPDIGPHVAEIPGDGIDNDCDPSTPDA